MILETAHAPREQPPRHPALRPGNPFRPVSPDAPSSVALPGLRRGLWAIVALFLMTAAGALADWPQWRGPEGRGVAVEAGALPESWEPGSPQVQWQTPIPGQGISSPVVSGGRVFVTTAYEGERDRLLQLLLRGATVASILVFAAGFVRRRRRAGGSEGTGGGRLESWVVPGVSWTFAVVAVAMSVAPHEFFPSGNPGRVWRLAGGIGLLGLAAAAGWFQRGSTGRLAGAVAVLGGIALLVNRMPHGALGPAPPSKWLPFVVPALALASWYLVGAWRGRRRRETAGGRTGRPLLAVALALAAALVFVPNNFFEGLQRAVVCLDLESGEILWQTPVLRGPLEQKWPNSSYATPTPAADGERVFAYFGHGLAGLDFDGRVIWRQRFPTYARHTRYGAGASPVLTADAVIVVQENEMYQGGPPGWMAAFDKASGRELWRIEPPEARDSYATPMLMPYGESLQILTPSWESLVAYDAESGDRLWSHGYPMQQMVASIARSGSLLALTGGTTGEKHLVVVRVEGEGISTGARVLWQTKRSVATIASPVLYDGKLFTLTTAGIMTCYEAESGEVLWRQRLDGEYFASLVAGDGKIYATNTEGSTSVIAAASEFELIGRNRLDDSVYASPAIAGGRLLIRTASGLACIGGGAARPRPAGAAPVATAATGP